MGVGRGAGYGPLGRKFRGCGWAVVPAGGPRLDGEWSAFGRRGAHPYPWRVKTFDELYAELADKAATRPEGSGTVRELDAGVHAIGKKIVEEAAEVWMAAEHEGKERTAEEISQLLYHLQVLMIASDLTLDDVYTHL